jgi:hypothetical protein
MKGWIINNYPSTIIYNWNLVYSGAHYELRRYLEGGNERALWLGTHRHGFYEKWRIPGSQRQSLFGGEVFGKKHAEKLQVTTKCKIKKNKITGTSKAKGVKKYEVLLRLTRIDSLE